MNPNPVTQNLVDKINTYSKAGLPMDDLESFLDSKLVTYNSVPTMDSTAIMDVLGKVNITDGIHKLALTHTPENVLSDLMQMLDNLGIDPEHLSTMKDGKNSDALKQVLTELVINEMHVKLQQLLQLPNPIGQTPALEVLARILQKL